VYNKFNFTSLNALAPTLHWAAYFNGSQIPYE
jgi:hypothetical protein